MRVPREIKVRFKGSSILVVKRLSNRALQGDNTAGIIERRKAGAPRISAVDSTSCM